MTRVVATHAMRLSRLPAAAFDADARVSIVLRHASAALAHSDTNSLEEGNRDGRCSELVDEG